MQKNIYLPNPKTFTLFPLLILAIMMFTLFQSCDKDDDDTLNISSEVELSEVIKALGGKATLDDISQVSFNVVGKTYEYEQASPAGVTQLKTNDYAYAYSSELNARKIRREYSSVDIYFPSTYSVPGPLVIVNDNEGTISRQSKWITYYLGANIPPHNLFTTEVEANLKNHLMFNPLELIKNVAANYDSDAVAKNLSFEVNTRIASCPISVNIDAETKLPVSASTEEADFLKGDIPFEIFFKDWVTVGDTKYPSKLEYVLDNRIYKEETISNVNVKPQLPAEVFEPEPITEFDPLAYDAKGADEGIMHTQFFHRWDATFIPWGEPTDNGAIDMGSFDLTQFHIDPQYVGENVKIIGRPDNRLWALAIKTADGIVMVDAPLNQDWTRSLLNAAKTAFSGEEVVGVISTQARHDHFGGIREAAYEAGKIYIADATPSVDFLNRVLDSEHTIHPDNLAKNPRSVEIETVSDVTYLDDGAVEIHRLSKDGDALFVYIPEYKVIYQTNQLWNGTFMYIWDGNGPNGYSAETVDKLAENAKELLDYIEANNLDVENIIGSHGGLGPISDLVRVANKE